MKRALRRAVGQVRAVDDVSFTIAKGQTLGLVGESGSGKTTLAAVSCAITPTAGQVLLHVNGQSIDVTNLPARELRPVRRHMQMVFQTPTPALTRGKTILDIVGELLRMNKVAKGCAPGSAGQGTGRDCGVECALSLPLSPCL
ncbi:MAG: ATP-binding cassette domain-containing protein [Caldilineaceae bacterium]